MPDSVIPPVVPPIVPPAAPWYGTNLDAEGVGYLQNRGLHDKPVDVVALETIKAHREAQKLIGVPQDQLLRLPKDKSDEAGWKQVYQRLGAPAEASKYDFTSLKGADGKPASQAFTDTIRATAFARGLSQDQAVSLAADVLKFNDAQALEAATVKQATITKQKEDLAKNWGQNYDAKMVQAKSAAANLKITEAEVNALEAVVGYDRVMEVFANIGARGGDAPFLRNTDGFNGGLLSREQATERKRELMNDPQWKARYMEGGAAENREFSALNRIIVGDDTEASRRGTGR